MKWSAVLYLLLGALLLACNGGADSPAVPASPAPPTLPPSAQPAALRNVIDGDTIDVDIAGAEYRVRYIGIDTPERDMPFYDEATRANRDLVTGQTLYLVKDVSETDRYGRLLRYVYLADGTLVNAALVESGYAQAVTFPPDVAFAETFRRLQQEARDAGRGLWASP
jgi:micrococcal nuclease